jgi:FMN phosphatase YigB (HAD superfamily)
VFPAVRRNRWVTFDDSSLTPDSSSLRPGSDIEPLLAELRLRGYKLGVLTNRDDAQFETAHRRFRQPFDLFVTAERIRAHKPDPWHFRAFQLLTHVRTHEWVHIASDWKRDIVPAERLGVQRVWLDRDRTGEDPSRASVHVHTAAEAVRAVDWLFQDQAACAC